MSEKADTKLTVSRFAKPGQQFSGRKEDFDEYKQGLMSMINCNSKTSSNGKYLFDVYPEDATVEGGYRVPQRYRKVEVPRHWPINQRTNRKLKMQKSTTGRSLR